MLVPISAGAKPVSCPGSVDHVLVEAGDPVVVGGKPGHEILAHGYLEQDVGGDYDENEPQLEWNDLKYDSQPIVAHCFPGKDDKNSVDLKIPVDLKKCVYVKATQQFYCE